jgi:hypothetical protein
MPNGVKVRIEASHKHTRSDVREALLALADQFGPEATQEAA